MIVCLFSVKESSNKNNVGCYNKQAKLFNQEGVARLDTVIIPLNAMIVGRQASLTHFVSSLHRSHTYYYLCPAVKDVVC